MPARLLAHLYDLKMMGASGLAFLAAAADAVNSVPQDSWESYGLKTLLILAIVYLVRQREQDQKDFRKALTAERADRDAKIREVIADNTAAKEAHTKALQELRASTDLQTSYFKTIAQTLINREIKPELPKED